MVTAGIGSKAELIETAGLNRSTAYRHLNDVSVMTVEELLKVAKATGQEIVMKGVKK